MKAIKSYFCFTPFLYRILVLAVTPAICCVLECRFMLNYMIPMYLISMLLVIIEVFADYWTFGGICAEGSGGAEYMKSSAKGKNVLKRALLVDCIRKFLWVGILMGVNVSCYCMEIGATITMDMLQTMIGMTSSAYIAILVGNYIGRYVQNYGVLMLIANLAGILYLGVSLLFLALPFPLCILGVAVGIGMTYLSIWNVMRKMEESYYDGKD